MSLVTGLINYNVEKTVIYNKKKKKVLSFQIWTIGKE